MLHRTSFGVEEEVLFHVIGGIRVLKNLDDVKGETIALDVTSICEVQETYTPRPISSEGNGHYMKDGGLVGTFLCIRLTLADNGGGRRG